MRAPLDLDDRQQDEREIRALSDQSGVAPARIRTLFRHEHARLGMGAKVRSYLAVLTASNVRGMLRRVAQREAARERRDAAQAPRQPSKDSGAAEQRVEDHLAHRDFRRRSEDTTQDVHGWEDDGGTVREAR